jgi:addiction module HigA family antidote
MPTKSRLRITTERRSGTQRRARGAKLSEHRLPLHRPPTHPGEMLLEEFVKPLGITQSALALRLGVSFPRLNELIRGKRSLTPDTALRLARVVGMSADFWLGLQLDWDLWHAIRDVNAEEISRLVPLRTTA